MLPARPRNFLQTVTEATGMPAAVLDKQSTAQLAQLEEDLSQVRGRVSWGTVCLGLTCGARVTWEHCVLRPQLGHRGASA